MPSSSLAADHPKSRGRAARKASLLLIALSTALGSITFSNAALADAPTRDVAAARASDASPGASASDAEVQRKAQSISRQTMSPFCPGRTLSDCPSESAAQWRREIHRMVARGDTAQQIQEELERRAGGDLSGSPHREAGYGLSIGLAAAAVAVLFGLLHWIRGRQQDSDETPPGAEQDDGSPQELTDPSLDERLEQDLAEELGDDDDR